MNSSIKYHPLNIYKRIHRTNAPSQTLNFLYKKWLPTRLGLVSRSAIESYKIAYDHIQSIVNIPINLLKYSDMQSIIDDMRSKGLSYASVKKVRTLLSLLIKYAQVNDIPITDYSKHLNLGQNVATINRKPFTRQQIRSQFKSLMRSINCDHTTHDCRHTVASLLDRYGANPNAVRSILGHKTGDVTIKVYTHKAIRELRKTIELLP